MRTIALMTAALLAASSAASAETLTSQAKPWNLNEEVQTAFAATVVDVACELGGDCPEACGAGNRHLGLLDEAGRLVLVGKNGQTSFNGAVVDLAPFCGKAVEVDGNLTGFGDAKMLQIQFIREAGAEEWAKANKWTKAWAAKFPEAEGKGPWFRRDPRIKERIEANGYLGLGLEADEKFIAEW